MLPGPIDWENPPSTRVRARNSGPRLGVDAVVFVACSTILWILVGALVGTDGISASGVRRYLVEGLGGSTFLLWGVTAVVALAALYALIDALRALAEQGRAQSRTGGHS
ncbi:MAG: hypothetical protein ABIJ09_18485 [Pseudomonadota bacterium]